MELHSLCYKAEHGWSCKQLPKLDSDNMLIILFGAPAFAKDIAPFKQLSDAYPKALIAGCSTSGEIHHDLVKDDSLSVVLIRFEKSTFKVVFEDIHSSDESFDTGRRLASQFDTSHLKGLFVLSDGLKVNGSELVKGLQHALPKEVLISGGLAGDKADFDKTWVIQEGYPKYNSICAIGFYGESLEFHCGSKGGWSVFGPQRRVTKSSGNVLHEIDGRPALDLYKEYLGDRASELPASALLFPLAIHPESCATDYTVRTILAVDEDAKTMTFAGDIPQGWVCQLMWANMDKLIDGASLAGEQIQSSEEDYPTLSLAVSCVGRRIVLGERIEEEVESVLEHLPDNTVQVGFYSYGEISTAGFMACTLHNQTMTLTTIKEK